jgi:hypothetical protein
MRRPAGARAPCIRLWQSSVERVITPIMEAQNGIIRIARSAAFLALILGADPVGGAQPSPGSPGPLPELAIVVVDSLGGGQREVDNYHRITREFTEAIEERNWPMKVSSERFAANTPDHPIELRIFFQGIRQETPVDLTFSAWITLDDRGKKHDFGIVRFRYNPHPGQEMEDRLDHAVRGAARITVSKMEPLLFPKAGTPKP